MYAYVLCINIHEYMYIYMCVCICVCVCVYTYIYIQISLNIIDIFCLHIFFWICSYSRIAFIVFGGNILFDLFNYWFPDCVHFYTWSTQAANVAQHICCFFETFSYLSSLSIILTLSHKSRWSPFSFYISSGILDFSTTAFRCTCSLTFRGWHVLPLYTFPRDGIYKVLVHVVFCLTRRRCLRRVESLLNVILISYGLHIF